MALHPKAFLRDMFRAGARKVLHRAGFRHPGGGGALYRQRGELSQEINVRHNWNLDRPGTLSFSAWQRLHYSVIWSWESPREFVVDPMYGDARDLAVEVGEWFRVELLPVLEPALDLLAIAREREARGGLEDLWQAAEAYRALGLMDDHARAAAACDAQVPF